MFEANWSERTLPKQYPKVRPPAHWSNVIGRTHDDSYKMFTIGEDASVAVKQFAETGVASIFDKDAQGLGGIRDIFLAPALPHGTGETGCTIFADSEHTKVSVMAKLVPSPDWFIGADSIDLCENGNWADHVVLDLQPMDAGTDSGYTFTAPNWATIPQNPITIITSKEPSHEANSFFYPELDELPPIGRLIITRQNYYRWKDGPVEAPMIQAMVQSGEKDTHCIVGEWSDWGKCSKTCGLGEKVRSRKVVVKQKNYGAQCPDLFDKQECGSFANCQWGGFKFGGAGGFDFGGN